MPIHLSSISATADGNGILAAMLKGALDHSDAAVVSEDGSYIQMCQFMEDSLTGQRIGKLIYTMFRNAEEKALNVLDLDMTLDSGDAVELRFLEKLPDSTDANEYYEVGVVGEGQHLQVETVNRYFIKERVEGTVRKVRTSAFPFKMNVFEDHDALNQNLGYLGNGEEEQRMAPFGLHERFAAPGSLFQKSGSGGETYSVIAGTIRSVRDVVVRFGEYSVSFAIALVESALGLLPAAMGRDVFDLDGLVPGAAVFMYADIKADFAVEQ